MNNVKVTRQKKEYRIAAHIKVTIEKGEYCDLIMGKDRDERTIAVNGPALIIAYPKRKKK